MRKAPTRPGPQPPPPTGPDQQSARAQEPIQEEETAKPKRNSNEVELLKVAQPIFGITDRRYRQMADEDIVPRVEKGKIDFVSATKALIDYYRRLSEGQGSFSLTDERTRLTRINADRKELDLKIVQGELIHVDIAMQQWGQVVMTIRSKLLAIPTKLSPLVLGCQNLPEIKETIERSIHEVMSELANPNLKHYARAKLGGDRPHSRDAQASEKAKGKRVGGRKKSPVVRKQR